MQIKNKREEVKDMKKVLMIALAVVIGFAFVTGVFAQEKPAATDKPAKVEKPAVTPDKPKAPKAAKVKTFKGEFVSADVAAKTIVAKNDKGEMIFDVSGIKKMPELTAGDKIRVAYVEKDGKMVAKAVKAEKKPAPKKVKKADKPAPPPAPAKK